MRLRIVPRLAANLGFLWPDRPLLARIEAASRAGFHACEMHFPYDVPAHHVAAACRRHGMTLLGINTSPGDLAKGEFGLGALPGREQDFHSALQQSIAYCIAAGGKAIHCMAGVVAPANRALAREVFVANLRDAAAAAKAHQLTLLLEPLNSRDHPDYFYSTLAEAANIIEALGVDNVKLQFDAYHVGMSEGDVIAKLARYLPIIGNVQIAAVPSRAEPDEGTFNYADFFAALAHLGYAGWIGCEYRPRSDTDVGLAWIGNLKLTLPTTAS